MNFRRYYVPDAIVFITQVVEARAPVFADRESLELLLSTLRIVKELHPFTMLAYAFMPDHFHILIRPEGDTSFSQVMHSLKPNFTKAYKERVGCQDHLKLWQKRFWDHIIRSEDDFRQHLDYVHYNPVKHGLVVRPEDWPHTSFRHWKSLGAYEDEWGWALPQSLSGQMDVSE